MFGRRVSVSIENDAGDTLLLVDPKQGYNSLRVEGEIEYIPTSGGAPRMQISIMNLSPNVRGQLKTGMYKYMTVAFGYDDVNGGELNTIFVGEVRRMIVQRPDAVTTISLFYCYGLSSAFRYGWYSGVIPSNTTYYDAMLEVATHGTVPTPITISNSMKNYRFSKDVSVYSSQIDMISEWANDVGAAVAVEFTNLRVIAPTDETQVTVLAAETENGVVASMSGLVGIPTMENDGVRFKCLLNPHIKLYSIVFIPNAIISDNQTGFESQAQAGAEFDVNGYYRVVNIESTFGNGPEQSVMSCKALAATEDNENE